MNLNNIKEFKKILKQEILKTKNTINQYKKLTKPIAPENSIGRVSRMDAINNKSVTEAALINAENKLKSLIIVRNKIGTEYFGICISCKKEIPIQRLLLIPSSQKCINCAN